MARVRDSYDALVQTSLVDLVTIVSLISETTTEGGLRVRSEIDRRHYPKGVTVTDQQLSQLQLERHAFHGDWNDPSGRASDSTNRLLKKS